MLFKSQTQHGDKDKRQILSACPSNWEFTQLCAKWRVASLPVTTGAGLYAALHEIAINESWFGLSLAEPRDGYRDGACQKGAPVPNPSMARRRGKSYLSTRRQKMSPPYQTDEMVPEGGGCGVGGKGPGMHNSGPAFT